MYYVTCSGCGRFVMSGNQCSHCLTENKQELPQRESYGRSRPPSPSTLPIVAGFVAAGLTYLKTTEPVSSAIVGWAIGLFANTPIGRTLFKAIFGICALAAVWFIWQFFSGLSKTYR